MAINERIKELIEDRGTNPFALGRDAGVNQGTVKSILKGQSADPGVLKVYALARSLKTTIEDLIDMPSLHPFTEGKSPESKTSTLPICFETGAGAWIEQDDYAQDGLGEAVGELLPEFFNCRQWFERLTGDSMNKIMPTGSLMQVVSFEDIYLKRGGYELQEGDIVIVERTRDHGFLRERSAKQVQYTNGIPELWPRSTNPRWSKPITLNDHPQDDSVTVTVVGLVKRAILNF